MPVATLADYLERTGVHRDWNRAFLRRTPVERAQTLVEERVSAGGGVTQAEGCVRIPGR